MARAIYNGGDIFLLDDPFSSLDPKMTREIFFSSIFGTLKDKTVILATNRTDFLEEMDRILFLKDNKIQELSQKNKEEGKRKEDDKRREKEKEEKEEKEEEVFMTAKRGKNEKCINKKDKVRCRKKIENKTEKKEKGSRRLRVEEEERRRRRLEEKKKNEWDKREEEIRIKAKSAVSIFWEYISYGNLNMLLIVILLFLGTERLKVEMIRSLVNIEFNYRLFGLLIAMNIVKNCMFNFYFLKINTKIHDEIIKNITNAEVN